MKLWQEGRDATEFKLKEWLFCVCRNRAFDHLRRESKMSRLDSKESSQIEDPEADPSKAMEQNQEYQVVNQIFQKLTMNEKEAIRLKFQEGLSYKQISEVTGHSVSYIGVLIHEGLKKIKQERVSYGK